MNEINDNTNSGHCPTRKQLELFFDGGCSDEDNVWIAEHVGNCEPCSQWIAHLAQKDAAFADLLAGSGHTDMQPRRTGAAEHRVKGPSTLAIYVKKISTLAAAATVLISILVLSGCGVASVIRFFQEQSLRDMYGPFTSGPVPVIVIGNAPVFLKESPQTANANYIGVDDAAAAGRILGRLKDMLPKGARVDLLTSAELQAGASKLGASRPVIAIGGPAVSQITRQIMEALKTPLVFVAPADVATENTFVRRATSGQALGILDANDTFYPHKPDAGITCAVVALARIKQRPTILVAGYNSRATRLATEAIVTATDVVDELQAGFANADRCVLVLTFDRSDNVKTHRVDDITDTSKPQ